MHLASKITTNMNGKYPGGGGGGGGGGDLKACCGKYVLAGQMLRGFRSSHPSEQLPWLR